LNSKSASVSFLAFSIILSPEGVVNLTRPCYNSARIGNKKK
jgi:hypothetical protein